MNHLFNHIVICEAEHILIWQSGKIALGYCKKLAIRFCERVANKIIEETFAPILVPVGEFFRIVLIASATSLLFVFASAIHRRSVRG